MAAGPELVEDIIAALAEVFPEIPLPVRSPHYNCSFVPTCEPIARFGEDDETLVFLAEIEETFTFVLAEPKLDWWHPNIPEWDPQPRFTIPEEWIGEMTAEQRTVLQEEARRIAASRLAKYAECVMCKERMAPEHLQDYREDGKLYCSGCGHRHLGIIH